MGLLDGMFGSDFDDPKTQFNMMLAAGLLGGTGKNLAGILGGALPPAMQARNQASSAVGQRKQAEMQRKLMESQILENEAQAERYRTMVAKGIDPKMPMNVIEWQYYSTLTPEQQDAYRQMRRQEFKIADLAGVPNVVRPGAVATTPPQALSSLGAETNAAAALAAAKGLGKVQGETSGEFSVKRPAQSTSALSLLDQADKLIDKSTGSLVGTGRDIALGAIGQSVPAGEAAAQLKVLQAQLMANQPRMEGPQSDRDVELYRDMAGRIGDPTTPSAVKKASLQTIREIHNKYAAGSQVQQSTQRAPSVGEVRKGYRFNGGDPADRNSWTKVQ